MRIGHMLGAAAIAAVFASSGCGKKGGGAEKDFESYVNAVCACKDMKCVGDEGTKFAEKHKNDKKSGDSNAKPSKKMTDLGQKMADCNKKIMEEEMKKTQAPPPAEEKPPTEPPPAAVQATDADVEKVFTDFGAIKDKVCACADKDCATKAKAEADQFEKDVKGKFSKPTADQRKKFGEIETALNECAAKHK